LRLSPGDTVVHCAPFNKIHPRVNQRLGAPLIKLRATSVHLGIE
jgi:hypothetical protein